MTIVELLNLTYLDQFHTEIAVQSVNHPYLFKDLNFIFFQIMHETANPDYITFARAFNSKIGIIYDLMHSCPNQIHFLGSNYITGIHQYDFMHANMNSFLVDATNLNSINNYEIKAPIFSAFGPKEYELELWASKYNLNTNNLNNKLIIDISSRNLHDSTNIQSNLKDIILENKVLNSLFQKKIIYVETRNFFTKPEILESIIKNIDAGLIRLLKK